MSVPTPVSPSPLIDPLQLSLTAVANLISCCLLGIVLEKTGILDQKAISTLSKLVYHLFQPCLLFTNIVKTLCLSSTISVGDTNVMDGHNNSSKGFFILSSLIHGKSVFFLLPCLAAFQVGTGYLCGRLMCTLMNIQDDNVSGKERTKQKGFQSYFGKLGNSIFGFSSFLTQVSSRSIKHGMSSSSSSSSSSSLPSFHLASSIHSRRIWKERRTSQVLICSTFANSGPLPLLFVDTIFRNFKDPKVSSTAIAYISFYLLGWSPLFWTMGYNILAKKEKIDDDKEINMNLPSKIKSTTTNNDILLSFNETGNETIASIENLSLHTKEEEGTLNILERKIDNENTTSINTILSENVESFDYAIHGHGSNHKNSDDKRKKRIFESKSRPKFLSGKELIQFIQVQFNVLLSSPTWSRILSPPTLACGLGLLVGISPLRHLFITSTSGTTEISRSAPLSPLFDSFRTMGAAYVPAVLLVLAGSLSQGLRGFHRRQMVPQLAAIMTVRFILLPLIVITGVATLLSMGLLPVDRIFLFIIVLEACMPPAQNTVLILQLEKQYEEAKEMATLISIVYVMAILPLALFLKMILSNANI